MYSPQRTLTTWFFNFATRVLKKMFSDRTAVQYGLTQ